MFNRFDKIKELGEVINNAVKVKAFPLLTYGAQRIMGG
jgi:hypothetical protein